MIIKDNFHTIMYPSIIIVSILILFSFVDLAKDLNKNNININEKTISVTNYAIQDIQENNSNKNQTNLENELYSENAYGVFYTILILIISLIVIIGAIWIFPKIKKYT